MGEEIFYSAISAWQLLVLLAIVLLLFGTRRIAGIGRDLGRALKSFRDEMGEERRKKPAGKPRRGKRRP